MGNTAYTNTVNAAAQQWGADVLTIVDADKVVTIAGADVGRRTLTVYSDPASIGVLYLVPNAGQARGGIRIIPGAGFGFAHAAPVYGYTMGGNVTVSVVSETGAVC